MTDFRREIKWEVGYDFREEDAAKPPGNARGCHGMEIRWLLHGPKATVQFLIFTGWLPTWQRFETRALGPLPADIGFHADAPWYEDQYGPRKCSVRACGSCFYDGSSLMAEDVFKLLVDQGEEAVWHDMERRYREVFETEAKP